MWIVLLALRRPYTFVVAALLLVILTPFILQRTPTDIFPAIDIPVVSIIWQYTGLDAKQMEQRIVYIHERVLSTTVNNIEHVESTSYNSIGVIKVFFQPKVSIATAIAQITGVSQTILKQMPPGATPPLIVQYNASTVPVLQYSLSSPKMSEQELNDIAVNQVRVGLVTVPGVVIPYPYGGKIRVVQVDLDLPALKGKDIQPQDVVNAINAQNLVLPSGTAKIGATEYAVSVDANTKMIDELNDLPIKVINGSTVYVRDVAQVHDGYQPQQNAVREDGVRGALLTILKAGNASTLDVVSGVKAILPRVLATVPPDLHVQEFADQSLFVRAAIRGVLREGIIAAALTALMILLFLGSWRSTFIIAISIPLSVLCSVATLSALGETFNLMTLGGLALAVGILVDDATVAIENIHRHMASGQPLDESIVKGSQEIAIPAFVSTLCICIVFVPMFFLTGVAHYLFVPLAEAVVFAILASYIISRTLVPTLVMWLYRNVHQPGEQSGQQHSEHVDESNVPFWLLPFIRFQRAFENGFDRFRHGYHALLESCFTHRNIFAGMFLGFCICSWLLTVALGRNFFPDVDAGQFLLHVRGPTGLRIEETERLCGEVNDIIHNVIPAHELGGILDNIGIPNSSINLSYNTSGVIGANDADILVSLKPGHAPTVKYVRELRRRLNQEFPGDLFYFLPADIVSQTLNFGLPAPYDVQVIGRDPRNHDIAVQLADEIKKIPGAVDVRVNQPNNLPQLTVEVQRVKAAQLGLTEDNVANAILLGLSGTTQVQPVYWLDPNLGIEYLIDVYAPQAAIDSVAQVNAMPIQVGPSATDQILANVATIKREEIPPVVSHYNVLPVTDVYGGVNERDLGSVIDRIEPLVKKAEKNAPRGTTITVRGQAETMLHSYINLGIGLVMAIILIYFLLVVNFQSWLDPFIIITALPGALAGVIWGLFLTQTTLSVPALMGAIMSMGVATANSVLVVSFARDNLRGGMTSIDAALHAGFSRIRPVLMTALAMIIGMLPMSLGLGEGGEQNAPLGRAVIGGLVMATIATLFFVPVVFSFMHRRYKAPPPAPQQTFTQ
jgi:multidrug efflux pump subunit AcrB